jgi:hypothetical protein
MAHKPAKKSDFLTASMKIGNCKGPITFKNDTQVFHADDVPKPAKERKSMVNDFKKSKILSAAQPDWNMSNHTNRPLVERRTTENHIKDRSKNFAYNYRAESLDYLQNEEPVDKPTKFHMSKQLESTASNLLEAKAHASSVGKGTLKRTEEMPVHPLLESTTWDYGIVRPLKLHEADLEKNTQKAVSVCKSKEGTWKSCSKDHYVSPSDIGQIFQSQVREQKVNGSFDWRTCVARSSLSKSAPRGFVQMPAHSKKPKFRPENVRKYGKTQHSGSWEFNAIEGRYMWSDTGSFDYMSKGDICKYENPNSFNYSGPDYRRSVHTLN